MSRRIAAGVLDVAYDEHGPADGDPVFLLHGFPYDIHAYDEVASRLAAAGCRVLVPYLRGYGPTRFRRADTPRSGQQAVLAHDLLTLMDALEVDSALLAGYDWGGRAACIVSALWPARVRGLVTGEGYNLQHIAVSGEPAEAELEYRLWYQWYFQSERGRAGLARNRDDICRLLWKLWSPTWRFDEATFARSAAAFANPDFVDVVIHSYRHRYALIGGDPDAESTERLLAAQPSIGVPTISIDGMADGVAGPSGSLGHERHFTGPYERREWPGIGHNLPQEAPGPFADAVLALR